MSYEHNLKLLKADFSTGQKFTLFVGAGINASPDIHLLWNDLIRDACLHSFRKIGNHLNLKPEETKTLLSLLGISNHSDESLLKENNERILTQNLLRYLNLKDFVASHFPIEVQVSIIKTLLGDAYIPFLQENLYTQCNKDVIRKAFASYNISTSEIMPANLFTLYVIARMVLLNPQIESIITYNYDNFLTFAINHLLQNAEFFFDDKELFFLRNRYNIKHNNSFKSLTAAESIWESSYIRILNFLTIPIYHVHGYIPPLDEFQNIDKSRIILSMDEYCASMMNPNTWNTAIQLDKMLTTHCLFIGSSLTDLTTKRMINNPSRQSSSNNLYVLDAYSKDVEIGTPRITLRKIKDSYLESLGVKVVDCDTGFTDLFKQIHSISAIQSAINNEKAQYTYSRT